MKKLTLVVLLTSIFVYGQGKSNLIKSLQNNEKESLESFKLVGHEEDESASYLRYELPDKDQFSITLKDGEMVYLEINHMSEKPTTASLFDFHFQETNLSDIHKKFNSSGFIYENRNNTKMNNNYITFTCYKIKDSGLIITFINAIDLDKLQTIENQNEFFENLALTTIIVAKESYLDTIWGEDKVYQDGEDFMIELE